MPIQNNPSEVARLRERIDREYDAAHQGLHGLALGTARHDFIHARMQQIGNHYTQLVSLVGEDTADQLLCQANDQSAARWQQSREQTPLVTPPPPPVQLPSKVIQLSHLLDLHTFLAIQLGSLLPSQLDLSGVEGMLDVACGDGRWVLDMARKHQRIEVVGLDSDTSLIAYAQSMAQTQGMESAFFLKGDMHHMSLMPDACFDLVHARFLAPWVGREAWPALLQELARVCVPGGMVCWVEAAAPVTTSPAFDRFYTLLMQALLSTGDTTDITPLMDILLHEAGCQQIQQTVAAIDFSVETSAYTTMIRHSQVMAALIAPLVTRKGMITLAAFEQLCQQMLLEMLQPNFRASWNWVSVWGRKYV